MNQGNSQKPKILYVEDDPKSRLIVKKLLESTGCEVHEASDGETGVEKALDLKPDAILMDIMLPGMDGLEAVRRIRSEEEISTTPIIAITAKAMVQDREQILKAGCDHYIAKPIDLPRLLQLLSQVLKKKLLLKIPQSVEIPEKEKREKRESIQKTLLVVDDTPKNVLVLQKIFSSEGYTILTAPHGRAALDILENHSVDLIVSDIAMPKMDGYRLCYEIMKNPETRNTRFIFYSSHYSNKEEVDFGLKLGADHYMVRPLEVKKLINTVKEVLRSRKKRPAVITEEEFQRLHGNLLTSKIIEIAPRREPFEKSGITVTLEMGRSYLVKEKTPQKSYDIFLDHLSLGFSGLCLTRTHPKFIKTQYNLEKTPFIWLSTTNSPGFISTIDLTELSLSVKNFVSKAQKSIILLDGFEFLASKMGFHVMLEFLQSMNEFVSNHDCILLLPVDPDTLNQRELSMLERELAAFV
jgi:two-component system cell cycle response regulator DivK